MTMPNTPTVFADDLVKPNEWKQASVAQKITRGFFSTEATDETTNCRASLYKRSASPKRAASSIQMFSVAHETPATNCGARTRMGLYRAHAAAGLKRRTMRNRRFTIG